MCRYGSSTELETKNKQKNAACLQQILSNEITELLFSNSISISWNSNANKDNE